MAIEIRQIETVKSAPSSADFLPGQEAAGGDGSTFRLTFGHLATWLAGLIATLPVENHDTSAAIEQGKVHTNFGAAAAVTFSLPAATTGRLLSVVNVTAHGIIIDPDGTDLVRGAGAGEAIEMLTTGQLDLVCRATGVWEVASASAIWEVAP